MLTFANAKINIGLNIIEKRNDGYHNLETVFYPVRLYDVLEINDAEQLSCKVKGIAFDGDEMDNLCVKAFKLLQKDFSFTEQEIVLLKNIPVGAGLGGGSSDAAFLIKMLNERFSLGMSYKQMEDYARQLGADCAFFIRNTPVYAFNKGDQFEAFQLDLSSYYIVLVMPPVHVATAVAYAGVKPGRRKENLRKLLTADVSTWKEFVRNDFEVSVFKQVPVIGHIKNKLYEAGALYAAMSGSGSSVFGIFAAEVKLPELEKRNKVFYNV